MKKLLSIAFFCGMLGLCAEHVIIGKGKFEHFNYYGNVKVVKGKEALQIRFGGCNSDLGGALQSSQTLSESLPGTTAIR